MKVSEEFAGNYLKAADVPQPRVFTMTATQHEQMPDGVSKPVLRLQNETRGLVGAVR